MLRRIDSCCSRVGRVGVDDRGRRRTPLSGGDQPRSAEREELIAMKQAADRPIDRIDIDALERRDL
jgi:hypothetical protein